MPKCTIVSLIGALSLGLLSPAKATTYIYCGEPTKGSLPGNQDDWKTENGTDELPESSAETTLKIEPTDSNELRIEVTPKFTTAGRIVFGGTGRGWSGNGLVLLKGQQPLQLEGSEGKPGEFLLEFPRSEYVPNKNPNNYYNTGVINYIPLSAPNGLIFGGAGAGPGWNAGHRNENHRLNITEGIQAGGACTKIGPSEVVLSGAVHIKGRLRIQEGPLVVAAKKEGVGTATMIDVQSIYVEEGAKLDFAPTRAGEKIILAFPLGSPDGAPLIEGAGTVKGLPGVELELKTTNLTPPSPGLYRILNRTKASKTMEEFLGVKINGQDLPAGCRLEYDPKGLTVDLVVQ